MDWLERMNWSFLDDDDARAVWEEARRRFFEEDETFQDAFINALHARGIGGTHNTTRKNSGS